MVTIERIDAALKEADRFIKAAKKVKTSLAGNDYRWNGNQHTAAAKRASMDLARVLTDLRRTS